MSHLERAGPTEVIDDRATERPSRRWWALAVIAIAQLMVIVDATVVIIALPSAQKALHISDIDGQWVISSYTLTLGGLLLLGGRIADYIGRKRLFLIGLIGFAAASALGGAAQNDAMLLAARTIQGAFAAVLGPAALSLITVTFTETKERIRALSLLGATSGGGAALGLILGGLLTQYASWRWCLLINVPIAVFAAGAGFFLLSESRSRGGTKYDVRGAVLSTAGLLSLVYGFSEAAQPGVGWASVQTLGYLALAAILLAAFVVVELRSPSPLLPLRIILDRNRAGCFLAALLVNAAVFAMLLFLTYYLQDNLGLGPLKSGLAFVPYSVGIIVTAGLSAPLLPKVGPRPMMIVGLVFVAFGLFSFTLIGAHSSWLVHVLPSEILIGVGLALVFLPLSSLALTGVDPDDVGVASSVFTAAQWIGRSLSAALLSTVYATAVSSYLSSHHLPPLGPSGFNPAAAIHGYHVAFWIAGGFALAALITIVALVKATNNEVAGSAVTPAPAGDHHPEERR
jgi:EmrB/QacA subfamily drug resistance transporter